MHNCREPGQLKRRELLGGLLYIPCYLFLTVLAAEFVLLQLGVNLSSSAGILTLNLVWAGVNCAAMLLIFRSFLTEQLRRVRKTAGVFFLSVLLALALYFVLSFVLSLLYATFHLQVQNSNNEAVNGLLQVNLPAMLLMSLLLAPVTEECLCRALIFVGLYRKSPIFAYALSMGAFSLIHVLSGIGAQPLPNTLLCFVQYLPAGFVLAWVTQKSGSLWAAILTHSLINLLAFLL